MIRVILFTGLLFVGLNALCQQPARRPAKLPPFSFYGISGQALTNQALKKDYATVVIFFDPDCEHCQQQAEWIQGASNRFSHTQFLWISTAELPQIKAFQEKYFGRGTVLPAYFAKDKDYKFDALFGYSVAPTVLVFSPDGSFRRAFSNEVAADEILAAIH